ncbi:hypothetical protein OIU14_13250 [Thalassobacter stenotrophicus]|uniref:hypothetical protein n=1 Tax=Thalassobacter stenotrophicus TaxID=266809 RepID=UPI0022A9ACC5|nr:hypothetical protein [Thalassobacter stenotrophicus]UYP67435.1 hypothetical protein OIU14_13250 [Thalassobacter stenotrophicus]
MALELGMRATPCFIGFYAVGVMSETAGTRGAGLSVSAMPRTILRLRTAPACIGPHWGDIRQHRRDFSWVARWHWISKSASPIDFIENLQNSLANLAAMGAARPVACHRHAGGACQIFRKIRRKPTKQAVARIPNSSATLRLLATLFCVLGLITGRIYACVTGERRASVGQQIAIERKNGTGGETRGGA